MGSLFCSMTLLHSEVVILEKGHHQNYSYFAIFPFPFNPDYIWDISNVNAAVLLRRILTKLYSM